MNYLTDEEVFDLYRKEGNLQAFDVLYSRYQPKLKQWLGRRVRDVSVLDDVIQVCWMKVMSGKDQYKETGRFSHWLGILAFRTFLGYFRLSNNRKKYGDVVSTADLPYESIEFGRFQLQPWEESEARDLEDQLHAVIKGMPNGLRAAVTLVYLQNKSYQEAAGIMGIPLGTVRSRLHRAIEYMKEKVRV